MRNTEIKREAREQSVRLWQIAEKMHISEATITRMFRKEFTDKEKAEMQSLITQIAKENQH